MATVEDFIDEVERKKENEKQVAKKHQEGLAKHKDLLLSLGSKKIAQSNFFTSAPKDSKVTVTEPTPVSQVEVSETVPDNTVASSPAAASPEVTSSTTSQNVSQSESEQGKDQDDLLTGLTDEQQAQLLKAH